MQRQDWHQSEPELTWDGSLKKSFASLSVSERLKSDMYSCTPGTADSVLTWLLWLQRQTGRSPSDMPRITVAPGAPSESSTLTTSTVSLNMKPEAANSPTFSVACTSSVRGHSG